MHSRREGFCPIYSNCNDSSYECDLAEIIYMKLGAYTIIKKIAEGGVAEIFLVKGKTLQGRDKYLVCKCIKDSIASDEDFLSSILQEAQLSVRMRHPNILEVFDLCASEDKAYLTMEYMDANLPPRPPYQAEPR